MHYILIHFLQLVTLIDLFFDVVLNGDYMRLGIFGNTSSYTASPEISGVAYSIQQGENPAVLSAFPGANAASYKQSTFKVNNPEYDFNYYKMSNNFVNYLNRC